jgi:large subunit ribosomal protein L9
VAAEKLAAAQAIGQKLAGLVLEIGQKAGVDGRLFGSVTNHDIADAMKAKGFVIEKAAVRMPTGPLKMVGDHPVGVAVHTDVVVDINIRVVGEQA